MWKVTLKGILRATSSASCSPASRSSSASRSCRARSCSPTRSPRRSTTSSPTSTRAPTRSCGPRRSSTVRASATRAAARSAPTCCPTVRRRRRRVEAADGQVQGFAIIVDKDGDALGSNGQGAPTLGFSCRRRSRAEPVPRGRTGRGARGAPTRSSSTRAAPTTPATRSATRSRSSPRPARNEYTLVGIAKFGDADSLLGATIAAVHPDDRDAACSARRASSTTIDVKADAGVSQDEVVRNIRAALQGEPSTEKIEVLTGEEITEESQSNLEGQPRRSSTPSCWSSASIALFVGSFIIYNTFSIIVAQRSRELALLRAIGAGRARCSARCWSRRCSSAWSRRSSASSPASARRRAQGAARRARPRHPGERRSSSPPAAIIWSFVVGMVVTVVAAIAPALRAARIPPIAAMRDVAVDSSSTSPRRAVFGIVITLARRRVPAARASSATAGCSTSASAGSSCSSASPCSGR